MLSFPLQDALSFFTTEITIAEMISMIISFSALIIETVSRHDAVRRVD